mmetsp:Transcript_68876/g.149900  ORF Transcript_68876/g.149900 Transcript_68876/m.149900 type:complete len:157 (-) Transcript_68876:18-488(-)
MTMARSRSSAALTMGMTAGSGPLVPPLERSHLLFPPIAADRQSLRQVFSEPTLRANLVGRSQAREEACQRIAPADYREGLVDMLRKLDEQTAMKQRQAKQRLRVEKAMQLMNQRRTPDECRAPWTYCDPAAYFENTLPLERGSYDNRAGAFNAGFR